jgi:hypothetical protein
MRDGPALRLTPLQKLLWGVGMVLATFIVTAVVMNARFLPADKAVGRGMMGLDFSAFYTAGQMVRAGHSGDLYDIEAVGRAERALAAAHGLEVRNVGPWWNPPFYALVFVPLSALPYEAAIAVWWGINVACFVGACGLLVKMLPAEGGWRSRGLVPVLAGCSMPAVMALSHGQNTPTSLLIVAGVVTLWRRQAAAFGPRAVYCDSRFWCGVLTGLLLYKPQLAAVLGVAVAVTLGWRAVLGMGVTGGVLLGVNVLTLPGTLSAYVRQLPANVRVMQVDQVYMWERHVTLKAFWRLLLQGREAGEMGQGASVLTLLSGVMVGAGLLAALWNARERMRQAGMAGDVSWTCAGDGVTRRASEPAKRGEPTDLQTARDGAIAATILVTPLLMPFYFDYDLLLLAVPAVLTAASGRATRGLVAAWAALYTVLLFNVGQAGWTNVNLAVVALTGVAVLQIRECFRRGRSAVPVDSAAAGPGPVRALVAT